MPAREGEARSFSRQGDAVPSRRLRKKFIGISDEVQNLKRSAQILSGGFNQLNTKIAFTLAEVLITLAVIGVVAALTIPVLVNKYQKKQLYSQFMKAYNTVTNVMDNAVAEYGEPDSWHWGKWVEDEETGEESIVGGEKPIEKYILSQLKYVKTCDEFEDCFASDYTFLGGGDGSDEYYPDGINGELKEVIGGEYEGTSVVLTDGSVIGIGGEDDYLIFIVDTNGKKGPNVYGRDLFTLEYTKRNRSDESGSIYVEEYEDGNNSSGERNCDPNGNSDGWNGIGCASRMLQEGAMNY